MKPEARKQKLIEHLDEMFAKTEQTMRTAKNSMPAEYRGFMDERISLLNQQKQRLLKNIDIYLIGNEDVQFKKWHDEILKICFDLLSVSDATVLCQGDTYAEYLYYKNGRGTAKIKREYQ